MSEEHIIETRNGSSWQLPAIIVLGLVAIAGLGFGWNASSKLDSTQQDRRNGAKDYATVCTAGHVFV